MNAWSVPGYTEYRELGSGGSGRVVLAVHDTTGVPVAVKYLSERLRADSAFLRSFRAEARLLSGLDTPHVVGLYEYVEAPRGAAIVMELVDGVALSALLRQEGPTGPEAALVVLKGSLLGLAAAHRAGVVHRDYKPENVLVATDGSSKLVDFGIATGRGSTPGVAGTPAYMAPEQWNGEPASPAADVYAATATFYECLTGRKPFSGDNFAELALQHIGAPVPEEEAPEPVRPLIRRGLAKEPGERPHNADVFVAELEEIAGTAYGPDWEERGQRKLAALAALLPLLLPYAAGRPAGTTASATTELGGGGRRGEGGGRGGGRGRSWKPGLRGTLAAAVALVVAAVAAVAAGAVGAVGAVEDGQGRTTARAVTTAGPVQATGTGPGAAVSAGPADSMSPSPTGAASPGGPPSSPASPSSPSVTDSATAGTTGTSTPPVAPPSPPAPPSSSAPSVTPTSSAPTTDPVHVKSVSVTGLRQTGTTSATATVDIATDSTGPVTVVVTWFAAEASGELGAQDGSQTFRREGATRYTIPLDHTFQRQGCYWGVRATTDPAAASGASSQQILIRRCVIS
ncbi:serine/threonine-protein kinase [Streptomyces lushanensis]|uniref:serine/threonine-protein kinase n=1 Tax=Streptomyces lushanensis TaxID=1434255 RepID=UPI0008368943|nr:serine/threonine-protein kinase [Streptomyces lushanensis]